MSNIDDLVWSDIQSNTMDEEKYLKFIKEKKAYENYKNYTFDHDKINKIREYLKQKEKKLNIFAIGADWCPDCSRQVPATIKIAQEMEDLVKEVRVLYGVKTNPFHKEGDPLWHRQHSPPEATDPKFDVIKIPIIYIFDEKGDFLGRVIEKPRENYTLEEEIWEIVNE